MHVADIAEDSRAESPEYEGLFLLRKGPDVLNQVANLLLRESNMQERMRISFVILALSGRGVEFVIALLLDPGGAQVGNFHLAVGRGASAAVRSVATRTFFGEDLLGILRGGGGSNQREGPNGRQYPGLEKKAILILPDLHCIAP